MNTNESTAEDLSKPNAEDMQLAMIAAPFMISGLSQAEALDRAQILLHAAFEIRFKHEVFKMKEAHYERGKWTFDWLAKQMKLNDPRSVWKHVEGALEVEEVDQLMIEFKKAPASKIFPWKFSEKILSHQKEAIQKRNAKNAKR